MSKIDSDQSEGSPSKQRSEKSKITEGYRFARGYIAHMCVQYDIPFDLDDDYKHDEDYYLKRIGERIFNCLEEYTSKFKEHFERYESLLDSGFPFNNFCECVRKVMFPDDYSVTKFLLYLITITAVVVNKHKKNAQHYYWDALLKIRDVLDFYLENGKFESAGGYDALCDENIILTW